MNNKEQIVLDSKGKPIAVQIPLSQYKKLMEIIEESEDIKAYDNAMKRKHEFVPFDIAIKELKSDRKSQ